MDANFVKEQIGRARAASTSGTLDQATLTDALDKIEKHVSIFPPAAGKPVPAASNPVPDRP